MNGNMESSMMEPYPPHSNGHITSNGHCNGAAGGNYPTVQLPLMTTSTVGGHALSHSPIPLPEFASHIDKLKMNNNTLFIQVSEWR